MSDAANGVSKAMMIFREQALQDAGFSPDKAAEVAPTLEGKLRSDVVAEATALAEDKGVYTPPKEPVDTESDDPRELARRHGQRSVWL